MEMFLHVLYMWLKYMHVADKHVVILPTEYLSAVLIGETVKKRYYCI